MTSIKHHETKRRTAQSGLLTHLSGRPRLVGHGLRWCGGSSVLHCKDRELVGKHGQEWASFLYPFETGNVARDNVADL